MQLFENNQEKDHSIFKKHYSNDPFRDGNFVSFEEEDFPQEESGSSDKETFSINADSGDADQIKSEIKSKLDQNIPEEDQKPLLELPVDQVKIVEDKDVLFSEYTNGGPKRSVKAILKNTIRQITIYAVALVIVVFALNASAYYKIIKNEIEKLLGIKEESPLMELVEPPEIDISTKDIDPKDYTKTVLKSSSGTEEKSQFIPPLNIEVFPVDNRLVIPRIDQNIPIVNVSSENLIKRDWSALEKDLQGALQDGVVHYPGTSLPGQNGNVVITGHSSYFPWDAGRFKDVFALLHDVVVGDKILVYHEQKKYIYEISEIKVVLPQDIKVLQQTEDDQITLITCTPVGTNLKRLIVVGKLLKQEEAEDDDKVKRS
ncbi:sortase [Patescibacteria group bacterium]